MLVRSRRADRARHPRCPRVWMTERSPDRHRRGVDYSIAPVRRNVDRIRTDIRIEFSEQGMNWIVHYFDRRLNSDGVSRAFASKEDALVAACDLMRRNCVVNFVQGPNDEKIDATTITAWPRRSSRWRSAASSGSSLNGTSGIRQKLIWPSTSTQYAARMGPQPPR